MDDKTWYQQYPCQRNFTLFIIPFNGRPAFRMKPSRKLDQIIIFYLQVNNIITITNSNQINFIPCLLVHISFLFFFNVTSHWVCFSIYSFNLIATKLIFLFFPIQLFARKRDRLYVFIVAQVVFDWRDRVWREKKEAVGNFIKFQCKNKKKAFHIFAYQIESWRTCSTKRTEFPNGNWENTGKCPFHVVRENEHEIWMFWYENF